ncbi:MAG TPA: NADH-quinone oxidoreductase subunit N [Phycisphaerae bacterium]|nr:NADH-quinone oxidoreductase subunit N [Phycisphaerae bacterium]
MSLQDYIMALAPEVILAIGACLALLQGVSRGDPRRRLVAPLSLVVLVLALIATVWVGVPLADSNPPGVRVTELTYYTRTIALAIGALILLVNWHLPTTNERGEFFSMVLFSILGVTLTAAANDLVLLFFALELVSVPTYVLVALSRDDARASEAAVKYFFLGAMSAALMVYGFSFLYGCAGSTVLAGSPDSIVEYFRTTPVMPTYAVIGLLLTFAGLSFKIAAVPFHVYAPDVYEGAASPVTGLLGFLPKLAGFVALVKVLDTCNWNLPDVLYWLLWIVAAATMTTGNVLALLQTNVKRILAYSSIAHSGYMLIGVLVGPVAGEGPMRDGVAAMLFYIAVYGVMNLGAFALLSAFTIRGEPVEELSDLGGLSRRNGWSALGLAICVFSLMGLPPTAGFLGKVYIFSSAFSLGDDHAFRLPLIVLAVVGVVNSAIAAAYYLRIAAAGYVGEEAPPRESVGGRPVRWALAICSLAMLWWFVHPSDLADPAHRATAQMPPSPAAHTTELALKETGES